MGTYQNAADIKVIKVITMKVFLLACIFALAVAIPNNLQDAPESTESPPVEPTEGPVETEKPKKCNCMCQFKKCKKSMQSTAGRKECYTALMSCVREKCDTSSCDKPYAKCVNKTEKQKRILRCERVWKQCFSKVKKTVCKTEVKGDLF